MKLLLPQMISLVWFQWSTTRASAQSSTTNPIWYKQKNENAQNFLHCIAQNKHFSFFLRFMKRAKEFGYAHLLKETDNAGLTPLSYLIIQCNNKPKETWKNLFKTLSEIDNLDNMVDADRNTLLHRTILTQNQNAFKALMKMVQPDHLMARNQDSRMPLHLATQEKILIEVGTAIISVAAEK